jgi:hypothetical protein
MSRLDTVSYYLSYTEFIPVVSTPSGVVHLICAVRDRVFGKQPSSFTLKDPDDFVSLARHKLDDWSHTTKGVLALIPILGNAILIFKWAHRQIELWDVQWFSSGAGSGFLDHFPAKLMNDKEFLGVLFRARKSLSDHIFKRVSADIKNDKPYVLKLIEDKFFSELSYDHLVDLKEDREIILAIIAKGASTNFFAKLPETYRNDLQIIEQVYAVTKKSAGTYYTLVTNVPNRDILRQNDELYVAAVRNGVFNFNELDNARQQLQKFGIAAVLHDHHQWSELPDHLQKDKVLLKRLLWSSFFNTDWDWDEITAAPWFKELFSKEKAPASKAAARLWLQPQMQHLQLTL